MHTNANQRRVITVKPEVINGARVDGVHVGPPERVVKRTLVCQSCGHLGGTLYKKGRFYAHANCAVADA